MVKKNSIIASITELTVKNILFITTISMDEIHLWTNEKKKGKKERMKKAKKRMQLLTISFLVAPMVLTTHSAFAFEEKEISEQNTLLESSSVTESTVDAMDKTSKITIMIDPVLIDRVQLKTQEGQVLTGSQDGVLEVETGTKLSYTILADEEQDSLALSINGGEEIDLTTQTFVVGTQNIFITALVETTPDIPMEDPSKPNEDDPTTDSSTGESEEKTESSTDKTTNSSDSSNSPEQGTNTGTTGTTGSHSSQSKPAHSSSPEQPKEESTNQTTSNIDTTLNKETTPPAKEKENGAMKEVKESASPSENFVTKKPINEVLSTNTNDQQQAIIQEALRHLGKPYLWGAKGPNQFDCSGLAYYVYLRATGHFIGTWTG
jgi:cell wall-associated NlpC family hydrolase